MIEADYVLQFDDYKAAHRLWLLNGPWPMFRHLCVMWILPGLVVGANCWSVWLWIRQRNDILLVVYGVTIVLTWLCLLLIVRYRKGMRRTYQEMGGGALAQKVHLSVDEDHIAVANSAKSEVRYPWSTVESLLEDERGGVLVQGTTLVTVPRRVLAEAQWAELRRLAAKASGAG
jgi:drug/metabolite transporter superfamily protein YnfA